MIGMASTFQAFVKGARKVRFFHCTLVSVCFVLLGFLVTTAVFLDERFPDVVSVVTGGRSSSVEGTGVGPSSRKLEADVESSLVGKGHRLGQSDVQREPEAAEESDAEDEEGDGDDFKQAVRDGAMQSELVGKGHQLGQTDNLSFKEKVEVAAPTVAPRVAAREEVSLAPVAPPVAARKEGGPGSVATRGKGRKVVSPAPGVQDQSGLEAAEESDSEGGEQSHEEEGEQEEDIFLDFFERAIRNGTVGRVNYTDWDTRVGCRSFWSKHSHEIRSSFSSKSLQNPKVDDCEGLRKQHVSVLVRQWSWIPDTLNNLYSCGCGLTCLWTNSDVLEENPDAHLYESFLPPNLKRRKGEPWRVYLDLEPDRNRAPSQDLFVSYHAEDDLQVTYAGASFHVIRNYYISPLKFEVFEQRGGPDKILHMFPNCKQGSGAGNSWSQNLHCAMSHYKFVLAIENTRTESYVTEKLFYALDAGSVPIYFGAPNVLDFVPPNSIIDGSKFTSMRKLAEYVKRVAADPVLYAEFHAWRRCGVMGPYGKARAVSLDSLPCRLCAAVSRLGGRDA